MIPDGKSYLLLLVYACVPGRSLISGFFSLLLSKTFSFSKTSPMSVSYGNFRMTNSDINQIYRNIKLIIPVD